jgi:hypothetical protein
MRRLAVFLSILIASAAIALHGQPLAPLESHCSIKISNDAGKLSLRIADGKCDDDHDCGSSYSNESMNRFTGISLADLAHEGAQLTATLTAEAGTFTCSGTVRDHALSGSARFIPDPAFVKRMEQMGFSGFNIEKLQAYAFVNVESAYVASLQQTHIQGITTDNLIALRIFNVDPPYIQSITAMGYELPDADRLIALRVQGVNAAEVREIRALGYQPTLDELIQIRIFHVTPDFIRSMEGRGFKNLTIAKLVQIRIFKLAE